MIKYSVSVFLCALLPITLSANTKIRLEDTTKSTISIIDTTVASSVIEEPIIPMVTLEDEETNDEGSADQSISPILNAGRDPFLNAASFNFSISRYRIRGYDNDYFDTYMNGIPTEYIDNGYGAYNLWSGLNDVTRNRESVQGLRPATFGFSGIGALYAIDARAGKQRKQLSITLGTSNRTYDLKGGLTYGSGISKKGWSYAVSLVGRWAKNGYVKGTSLQSLSYFASVQKYFKKAISCINHFWCAN